MTAISYQPSDELYARVRAAAAERDVSIRALIDTAVNSYLDSHKHDVRAMTASLIRRNRVLLDRLAELWRVTSPRRRWSPSPTWSSGVSRDSATWGCWSRRWPAPGLRSSARTRARRCGRRLPRCCTRSARTGALVDGNERTAWTSMLLFQELNRVNAGQDHEDAAEPLVLDVATASPSTWR